jgi:hypothetical protein
MPTTPFSVARASSFGPTRAKRIGSARCSRRLQVAPPDLLTRQLPGRGHLRPLLNAEVSGASWRRLGGAKYQRPSHLFWLRGRDVVLNVRVSSCLRVQGACCCAVCAAGCVACVWCPSRVCASVRHVPGCGQWLGGGSVACAPSDLVSYPGPFPGTRLDATTSRGLQLQLVGPASRCRAGATVYRCRGNASRSTRQARPCPAARVVGGRCSAARRACPTRGRPSRRDHLPPHSPSTFFMRSRSGRSRREVGGWRPLTTRDDLRW